MKRIFNQETTKLELHFEKEEYQGMTEEQKKLLKSAFLWGNKAKCWISRAKEPNLYRAKEVANKLGFTEEEKHGERLTFADQLQRKQEKAEARAERMEARAEKAIERAEQLQAPLNNMRGDTAFFTQPNINTSSGRSFTRQRERMYEAYERGFKEYQKSEYYRDRAETSRDTANMSELKSVAYCERRINETKKAIKAEEKIIIAYEETIHKLEAGEQLKNMKGELIDLERAKTRLFDRLEYLNALMDKEAFYYSCVEAQGGFKYDKNNIEIGYVVNVEGWGNCEVVNKGPKNVTIKTDRGRIWKESYSTILEIVTAEKKEIKEDAHPFKVGETFNIKEWTGKEYAETIYTITKATSKTITLTCGEKKVNRNPCKVMTGNSGLQWKFSFNDNYNNTFYRNA